MKPEIYINRDRGAWNQGRLEVVEEDGSNSTFSLFGVKSIDIKCDKQPHVQIVGQSYVMEHRVLLKIQTNTSTNEYSLPVAILRLCGLARRKGRQACECDCIPKRKTLLQRGAPC